MEGTHSTGYFKARYELSYDEIQPEEALRKRIAACKKKKKKWYLTEINKEYVRFSADFARRLYLQKVDLPDYLLLSLRRGVCKRFSCAKVMAAYNTSKKCRG